MGGGGWTQGGTFINILVLKIFNILSQVLFSSIFYLFIFNDFFKLLNDTCLNKALLLLFYLFFSRQT